MFEVLYVRIGSRITLELLLQGDIRDSLVVGEALDCDGEVI